MSATVGFDRSVFVNCPFDEAYRPLLRSLLFTITYVGLKPRIAIEALDSGAPRIEKIIGLIASCRYAIHDLSRLQAKAAGEFYRLNMPFELGVDVGCRLFGNRRLSAKRCLILEVDRYRYHAAISDLSGSDIAAHHSEPQTMVAEARNWLNHQAGLRAPGPELIWTAFGDFTAENHVRLRRRGFSDRDIEKLPVDELLQCIEDWVARRAPPRSKRRN